MKTLTKKDFELFEIESEYQDIFECYDGTMSDFWYNAICWVGYAMMTANEQLSSVWADNRLWWDTNDETRMSLYMTESGILMLENMTTRQMWRVEFNS